MSLFEKNENQLKTEDIITDFYDAMFGSFNSYGSLNSVEQNTFSQVISILSNAESLKGHIPILPDMLIRLLDALKDPHSDIFTFVEIIEKDPSFAAEVLKVANTAKYNRRGNAVVHLRRATSFLGVAGLIKIASTLLLADVIPCKPLCYQLYGRQIWTHSVQCATLCEILAKADKQNEADAYFVGLIHDLGKIIVFNFLSEALDDSFNAITPCSQEFKTLMTEMSLDVTYFIAKEWLLPKIYVQALKEQRERYHGSLGSLLYKANRLSESFLLFDKGELTREEFQALGRQLDISDNIFDQFTEVAPDIAQSIT